MNNLIRVVYLSIFLVFSWQNAQATQEDFQFQERNMDQIKSLAYKQIFISTAIQHDKAEEPKVTDINEGKNNRGIWIVDTKNKSYAIKFVSLENYKEDKNGFLYISNLNHNLVKRTNSIKSSQSIDYIELNKHFIIPNIAFILKDGVTLIADTAPGISFAKIFNINDYNQSLDSERIKQEKIMLAEIGKLLGSFHFLTKKSHGDVNPGQFFYNEQDKKCYAIDCGTCGSTYYTRDLLRIFEWCNLYTQLNIDSILNESRYNTDFVISILTKSSIDSRLTTFLESYLQYNPYSYNDLIKIIDSFKEECFGDSYPYTFNINMILGQKISFLEKDSWKSELISYLNENRECNVIGVYYYYITRSVYDGAKMIMNQMRAPEQN